MNLFDFIRVKKLIEEAHSPINERIRIFKVLGRPSMVIGGLEQSGEFIGGIWKKALKKIRNSKFEIRNSLILGLGGGMAAKLVSQFWPRVKIVGVEIDPVVIKLGKKHFGLNKIPNLKVVNANAVEWVKKGGIFDLVLVDIYLGDKMPKFCETEAFLERIKKLLALEGVVIFNRLFYKEKKKQTENFVKKLKKIFPKISFTRTSSNLLILGAKRYN